MKKIIIFASGSGTNAERITTYFQEKGNAEVTLIITNNPQAGVLSRAKHLGVPTLVADRNVLYHSEIVLSLMKQLQPDLIVLAGFLWKFPTPIIEAFPTASSTSTLPYCLNTVAKECTDTLCTKPL